MNEQGRNEADISRYTDVEYSPEGYKTVYRWGDFLEIAGGHVHNAMDTIDLVLAGGEYEGFNPRYAYTCEFVGCSTLIDGIALFRPVSRDGEDLTQIAFLRSDIDDDTGAYTERFEAGRSISRRPPISSAPISASTSWTISEAGRSKACPV